MRIRHINIVQWRHFNNIEIKLDDDAGLICIVGANGTGKSHLLELIAACAHRLGLSPGVEIPRGDPFSDVHEVYLQFYLSNTVSESIEQSLTEHEVFPEWDRTLAIQSRKLSINEGNTVQIEAGGITDPGHRVSFADLVVSKLRAAKEVHFLSLDADRAYPKKNFHVHDVAQAYEIDWAGSEYTRGRSFKSTAMLYDEWLKYFLAKENQSGTRLIKDIRIARQSGNTEPVFEDHFLSYKEALQRVLPHVLFTGIDSKKRTLLFDTTGLELTFDQLSGGEREIAFLIGQIDRFGLRQGLFLIDEPELHLNADLIRVWVSYLSGTVENGQIWLATHSLEAIEAAGQKATFILERNPESRRVDSIARLDTRPILSALSRAVGSPAFSISQLAFVFVEGEEAIGERERFRKLAGYAQNIRFMEGGSCKEVQRRVDVIKALASEAEAGIRIGGIVDRDFLDTSAITTITGTGVYVLAVHEAENFFIHPPTLQILLRQNGHPNLVPEDLIREASDARAGSWIFQHAMATTNAKSLPDILPAAKARAKGLSWTAFETDQNTTIQGIVTLTGFQADDAAKFQRIMEISAGIYTQRRTETTLWKTCEGKQVLNRVAQSSGYASAGALSLATFTAWESTNAPLPQELIELREYLARQ